MNVTESNEILQLFPESLRDQIKYVAVDSSGHRAGFYSKPKLAETHWHTDQPYYVIDKVDATNWRHSLVKIERDITASSVIKITIATAVISAIIVIGAFAYAAYYRPMAIH